MKQLVSIKFQSNQWSSGVFTVLESLNSREYIDPVIVEPEPREPFILFLAFITITKKMIRNNSKIHCVI